MGTDAERYQRLRRGPSGLDARAGELGLTACELEEARCVLERGEPRCGACLAGAPEAANGGDRAGRADRGAERKGADGRPLPPLRLVHASIVRVLLASLGDLILDVVVQLDAPLLPGDDRRATTRVGAGGQAANVAAWAAALGAQARYIGKRGDDAASGLAAAELAGYGVEVAGPAAGRGGVVVSIASSGDRSMASDRGSATELAADELEPAWLACDAFHLSGYALLEEPAA